MALRTLRLYTDEILRKKSKPVNEIKENILTLLDDMIETMKHNNGAGLAAPQVGVLRRIVTIDVGEGLIELINPIIVKNSGTQYEDEACLSVPGKRGKVKRPEYVKVKALDRYGKEIVIEGTEFLAIALCHEIDHLDGVLYTDRVISLEDIEQDESEK